MIDCYSEQTIKCNCCSVGCCDLFEIMVTADEAKALYALKIPGTPEFDRCFVPGDYGELVLQKGADGRCVFADGNLCKIHKIHGFGSKPLSCRVFPLNIQKWADGRISAECRFICPGCGGAEGKKLRDELGHVQTYANLIGTRRAPNDVVYSAKNRLPLVKVRTIHELYKKILRDESKSWPIRLYAAARILDFHRDDGVDLSSPDFVAEGVDFFNKAQNAFAAELGRGVADHLVKADFRNLLCGYLRDDRPGDAKLSKRLERAVCHVKIFLGLAGLQQLNPNAPAVPITVYPHVCHKFTMSKEAETAFRQFFYGKLETMLFCGNKVHHFDYETGLRHLLMSACILKALGSGFAMTANTTEISGDAMQRAVRLADFTFGRSPFFRMVLSKRWLTRLSSPKRFAGLLNAIW